MRDVIALRSWLGSRRARNCYLPEEGPLRRNWKEVGVIVEMNEYTGLTVSGSGGELPAGTYTRSYDQNGNLIDNDKLGALADQTKRRKYFYDAFNRLVRVEDGSTPVNVVATFAYDHQGRRVQKFVPSALGSAFDETYTYFYLGNQLIEEHKAVGASSETRQYVWGGGALLQYADSSGTY